MAIHSFSIQRFTSLRGTSHTAMTLIASIL
jgi:hypothetical protein